MTAKCYISTASRPKMRAQWKSSIPEVCFCLKQNAREQKWVKWRGKEKTQGRRAFADTYLKWRIHKWQWWPRWLWRAPLSCHSQPRGSRWEWCHPWLWLEEAAGHRRDSFGEKREKEEVIEWSLGVTGGERRKSMRREKRDHLEREPGNFSPSNF